MRIDPEISEAAIVLAGSFNPDIFTRAWFELHELLPEGTIFQDTAHKEITNLSTDWMLLSVTYERFQMETKYAPYTRISDLVLRIFKEHLYHTPISAFGINRSVHFCVDSMKTRDQIGRSLAPIEPWGRWGLTLGSDGEQSGMSSFTMSQVNPDERPKGGSINVAVEPSNFIGSQKTGIHVSVNDPFFFR